MPAKLTVAKIVSTANTSAWSQAYHAGGFTAVLSISQKKGTEHATETMLHKAGKELLDTLIAEYFTLVTKNLDTVKAAVEASIEKLPENISLSMVVGASVKNVLYLIVVNHGKALLKRGDKAGVLLELENEEDTRQVESVSGYLEHGDTIVLETKEFEEVLPQHELIETIDHQTPSDLAEMLSPKIHEAQNGGASAIIFTYHEEEPSILEKSYIPAPPPVEKKEEHHQTFKLNDVPSEEEPPSSAPVQPNEEEKTFPKETRFTEEAVEEKAPEKTVPFPHPGTTRAVFPQPVTKRGVSHSQKIFLTIAIIITIVLASSIFFFLSKQEEAKRQQIFTSVYNPAKTKYEEGTGLMDLNKTLALSDLQQAKDMVTSGESKLPVNSQEHKKLDSLLSQINASIQTASQVNTIDTTKASDTASPILTFAAKHPNAAYVTQDETNFYTGDNTGVTQYNQSSSKSKQLIQNSSDWKDIGGLGTFLGNIYVLDKQGGILKYVNGTSKQSYFASGINPDLSKATSMAIDRSIWILSSDGTILKFTRGQQDSFSVTGLDKAFSNPSILVTTVDDDNVYILDKGNSRLVVLKKSGAFVNQYQTGIIKNADGLDIDEKAKKAYILSGGTIYQMDLK